jgi:hypothetical protein
MSRASSDHIAEKHRSIRFHERLGVSMSEPIPSYKGPGQPMCPSTDSCRDSEPLGSRGDRNTRLSGAR